MSRFRHSRRGVHVFETQGIERAIILTRPAVLGAQSFQFHGVIPVGDPLFPDLGQSLVQVYRVVRVRVRSRCIVNHDRLVLDLRPVRVNRGREVNPAHWHLDVEHLALHVNLFRPG